MYLTSDIPNISHDFCWYHKCLPHLDGLPLLVPLLPALDKDVEAEHEEHAGHERDRNGDDAQPPRRIVLVQRAGGQFNGISKSPKKSPQCV